MRWKNQPFNISQKFFFDNNWRVEQDSLLFIVRIRGSFAIITHLRLTPTQSPEKVWLVTRELISSPTKSLHLLTYYKGTEIVESNRRLASIFGKLIFFSSLRTHWCTLPKSKERIQVSNCCLMFITLIVTMMKGVDRAVY